MEGRIDPMRSLPRDRIVTALLVLAVIAGPALLWFALFEPLVLLGFPVAAAAAWLLPARLWPERSRRSGLMLLAGGTVATVVGSYVAVLYAYGVAIEAGLCGDEGMTDSVLGWLLVPPYAVVSVWALREPRRLMWAWPLAPLAAASLVLVIAYVTPAAHGHCET
jgi:hypothetical protein